MSHEHPFTKDNLNEYLKELAKEYKKLGGKNVPAEIILIGGASVLINYGFRDMTYDMDAIINADSCMKEAINHVGARLDLPNGWMNSDFIQTASYSPKLIQHSKYYRTFSNIVSVRTISAEYLVAMKLISGRQYKKDLSDILGILSEQKKAGNPLSLETIKSAYSELYGSFDSLSQDLKSFIEKACSCDHPDELFNEYREIEKNNFKYLKEFQESYPNVLNENNLKEVLKRLREKASEGSSK